MSIFGKWLSPVAFSINKLMFVIAAGWMATIAGVLAVSLLAPSYATIAQLVHLLTMGALLFHTGAVSYIVWRASSVSRSEWRFPTKCSAATYCILVLRLISVVPIPGFVGGHNHQFIRPFGPLGRG